MREQVGSGLVCSTGAAGLGPQPNLKVITHCVLTSECIYVYVCYPDTL